MPRGNEKGEPSANGSPWGTSPISRAVRAPRGVDVILRGECENPGTTRHSSGTTPFFPRRRGRNTLASFPSVSGLRSSRFRTISCCSRTSLEFRVNDSDRRPMRTLSEAVATFAVGRADAQVRALVTRFDASSKNVASIAKTLREDPSIAPVRAGRRTRGRRDRRGLEVLRIAGTRATSSSTPEAFARRNPLAATGVAVVIGFAAARALKASAGDRFPHSS